VVEAIQGISQQAAQVQELVQQVTTGSQEQSRSIEQISAAVAQMQKVTQNTAASAEQGAAASQQMSAHAESMRSAVGRLYVLVGGERAAQTEAPKRPKAPSAAAAPLRKSAPKPAAAPAPVLKAAQRESQQAANREFPLDDGDFTSF